MKRTTIGLGLCAALMGVLASSCATTGGQTGDEEQTSCWSTVTPLALDAQSPLGFSAQDSLKLAAGEHGAVLHWLPTPELPYGPESGDGQVQVTIRSLGSARFATHEDNRATTELDYCPPSVLTDVSVELDSAGGALHESFQGMLVASSTDRAAITAALLGPHIAGRFAFEKAALAGRSLARIVLNFSFSAGSFSGAIEAGLEQAHGGDASSSLSLQTVPLACWGSAPPGTAGCAE